MTGFVQRLTHVVYWLLERRYRLVILAVAFAPAPLISFIATALMTLETIHRGGRQGLISAAAATAGVVGLAWVWGADPWDFGLIGGATLMAGVGLGVLVHWAGTLTLAFQATMLLSAMGTAVTLVLWPEPTGAIAALIAEGAAFLREVGAAEEQVQAVVLGWQARYVGFIAVGILAQLLASLIVGHWLATLAVEEKQFGLQFRVLRLGRVLGIPATLLMAVSLVLEIPLVQNLFPLAVLGFWFQGIAVVHAWGWARKWNPAIVAAVYVLLLPPFTVLSILGMASVGLIDNWVDLRAPLRSPTPGSE